MIEPSRILQEFSLKGALIAIDEIDNGLINNTYLVELEERSGKKKRYVLQRINDQVFTEPEKVMQNIALVTQHLGDNERSLKLFPTKEGENYFRCDAGCWRCYNFIENAITYDECESEEVAHNAAFAFATFSYQLSKLQPESLHTTIPDFHHTQKRFEKLQEVIDKDPLKRAAQVTQEIDFISNRQHLCSNLLSLQQSNQLPIRITHNDTKVNNVMMDTETHDAVCVIDLDTTMPGLIAHDFGDLVRTSISSHKEDAVDLSTVNVRPQFFKAIAQGYKKGFPNLTDTELQTLPLGALTITLEVGIRFLTDFLEGDMYFKTERKNQNLNRCRTQLKLVEELEKHDEEFNEFISKCLI